MEKYKYFSRSSLIGDKRQCQAHTETEGKILLSGCRNFEIKEISFFDVLYCIKIPIESDIGFLAKVYGPCLGIKL